MTPSDTDEIPVPYGHRLRPARASDLDRLLAADPDLDPATGSRRLAGWLAEQEDGTGLTRVLVDADETALLGTVRTTATGTSWWIVPECRGTDLEAALSEVVTGIVSGITARSGTRWG